MDPITHAVIGMTVSKLSGNALSLSDELTAAATLGALIPDMDILMQKWGDYVYLKNHRGASHSIIGILVSSALITAALSLFYGFGNLAMVYVWSLLGCASHTFFDLFNVYGAEIFWPFTKRRFSLRLLTTFDPVLIGAFTGYLLSSGVYQYLFLTAAVCYFAVRLLARYRAKTALAQRFSDEGSVYVYPSLKGFFRWHFIVLGESYTLVGEKRLLSNETKILKRLDRLDNEDVCRAVLSHVGVFFSDFTPLFHVVCEKVGNITKFIFIDLRYYMRGNFLHHAILEVDESGTELAASFNPYSMKRNSLIP